MNFETGKFKRDRVSRNGRESIQIRVTGLSVNSKFKDDEDIIIMSKTQFDKMKDKVDNTDEIIENLENKLQIANDKIESLKKDQDLTENPKYYNDLIQAKDEINNLKDVINNRNILIGNIQENINLLLDEFNIQLKKAYNSEIDAINDESMNKIQNIFNLIKDSYDILLSYIVKLEENYNKKIEDSSFITRLFKKDKLKLDVNKDKINDLKQKLDEINDYCKDYKSIFIPIEIPSSKLAELKLNSKDFNLHDLYIETADFDNNENFVVREVAKK